MKNKSSRSKLKNNINTKFVTFKQRKLYLFFIGIIILSFLFGLLFLAFLGPVSKDLVKTSLDQFFISINTNDLNYLSGFLNSIKSTVGVNLLIWTLGISIIGIPFIIFINLFKSFTLGFTLSSIIYFYGFKGAIIAIIYLLPSLIIFLICLLTSLMALSFSRHLFNMIFRKKEIVFRNISRRYMKLLGISTVALMICSLIEIYVIPVILKTMIS